MDYALLDWDNTLRKGYTLFSWIDYLINIGTISSTVRNEIDYYISQYDTQKISHDQLAEYTCEVFAKSLKGLNKNSLEKQIQDYMFEDNLQIYEFTQEIFNVLNYNNILPIVVSGAPSEILEKYRIRFNLYQIYGFVAGVENNIYSGKVKSNYGYNKSEKVDVICNEMGGEPIIAFGDSVSDFSMLSRSKKSVIVCKKKKIPQFNSDGIIELGMSPFEVKSIITELLNA
jgi:phosphoserine phosphatase